MENSCAIILNGVDKINKVNEPFIICADGGYNLLCGIKPDIIIGDFDSINSTNIDCEKIKYPANKDKTDSELCIDYALQNGYTHITFYGAIGGRCDQMLGNINLLGYCNKNNISAKIAHKDCNIYFCDDYLSFKTTINSTISILAISEKIEIDNSSLVKYPIENLTIELFSSRGISNISLSENFYIKLKSGKCYIIEGNYGKIG